MHPIDNKINSLTIDLIGLTLLTAYLLQTELSNTSPDQGPLHHALKYHILWYYRYLIGVNTQISCIQT